jgi:uncharacterized protein (UPF0332 family)
MAAHSFRDLLAQARHLATKDVGTPEQASLRRAVSTAYYALFHLLVSEASALLASGDSKLQELIARAFEHGDMYKACSTFKSGGSLPAIVDAHYGSVMAPPELKAVAQAFVDLQDARHDADYATHRGWTRTEALTEVERAEKAFEFWGVLSPTGTGRSATARALSGPERETVRLFLTYLVLQKRIGSR